MKKIFFAILMSYMMVSLAGAQGVAPTSSEKGRGQEREVQKEEVRTLKQGVQTQVQELKETFQGEVRSLKDTLQTQVRTRNASVTPAELKARREELRGQIEEKREELQARIKTAREDLRERLEKIKDEQKKQRVERIADQIDALNRRLTDHYLEVLERMEKVLEGILARAMRAEERGLEVSVVRAAVDEAHNAIEASRTAIAEQVAKTYTIEVSTEEELRVDVGKARQALHADLAEVRDTVRAAHNAVRNAAVILAQIPRIDEEDEAATSTPPTAPPPTEPPPAPPATSTPPAPPSEATSTATSSE